MKRFVLICLLLFSSTACALDPLVRVDVTVVGEEGLPVEDVSVRGDFAGVVSGSGNVDLESTNEDGVASVIGRSHFPVRVIAKKKNFYTTTMEVNTVELVDGKQMYKNKKVRMVLREKRNPIPLYAKRYTGYIPVANEWVGFDLEKADWLAPYGDGVVADIFFNFEGEFSGFNDAQGRLAVKFSSDGAVQKIKNIYQYSELIAPYEAPLGAYAKKEIAWEETIGHQVDPNIRPSANNNYFMQLRVVKNKKGEIESANYAKLYGDFSFSLRSLGGGVSRVEFRYYYNPTPNDRNLEFDVKRNLFSDLNYDERVNSP